MPTWPLTYRQGATNGAVDLLDGGTTNPNATLEVGDAGFSNVLLIFQLSNPAAGNADGTGGASLSGLPISTTGEAAAGAGTTAAEYRYKDRDGVVGPSGTVASGEITLSDTNIIQGNTYNLTSGTFPNP